MNVRFDYLTCCGLLMAGFAGCSSANGSSGTVDPNALPFVQCKVKLAGKDVPGAIVTLQAKDGKSPKISSQFDSEYDCYRFTTKDGDQEKGGVPEGSYLVAVTAGRGSKTPVPAKYAKAATSGLTLDVKKGEPQFPTLELTP